MGEQFEQVMNAKVEQARLGIEAEHFLASSVGQALLERAQSEYSTALLRLSEVDPFDSKEIARLQSHAWRADSVQGWLENIINNGREAEMEIRAMEGTDA